MSQTDRPRYWHQIQTDEGQGQLPFARFYSEDPSENPTIRPIKAAPESGTITVNGERELVIIGPQDNPLLS